MPDPVTPALAAPASGPASSGLVIRLFGPMEVRIGSHPLPRLRSRKGLWLLALLALRDGRDVERDWLAGTLWPDGDEINARRSLRQSLHDLRAALGPESWRLTGTASRTLRLDVDGADVDVLAFDAAITRSRPAGWSDALRDGLESAVRLYRGPLLEDCSEEWILGERQQRAQQYVAALERLAAAASARQEHATAAGYLQLAVAADAYREELQRALMEALAAGDNPASAMIAYRQFRALLWREMAAEPAEETTALFRRLREETRARARPRLPEPQRIVPPPSPTPGPRGNLPRFLSAFVGRERELGEVIQGLANARLVTLTGTGGIGKTRLAVRVAEEVAWAHADGAWFVDLAALTDGSLVPQAVARALQVPETAGTLLTKTLQDALGAQQILLVLDNCEHLIDACAHLADALLSCSQHLRILATSRQPLRLTGEYAWRVPSLSLPETGVQVFGCSGVQEGAVDPRPTSNAQRLLPGHLNTRTPEHPLLTSEAVRLFVERARAALPGFAPTEQNAPAVVQLCRRLDGIPLAIELAAARLKVLSIEQIAARLDDRFRLLTGGSRVALPRQQTLRATLDWSHDLLTEAERILLRRLSVFSGGFTLEAAEAVCSDFGFAIWDFGLATASPPIQNPKSKIQNGDVLDLLTQLVDRSLVGVERRAESARYVLLETTREYARDRLREAGEDGELRTRHARFFLALAERAGPELRGAAQAEWLRRLEEEHDNLRAAVDWCVATAGMAERTRGRAEERSEGPSQIEMGLRLGGVLGWFWWMRGYLTEGRERLQALLAQSGYTSGTAGPGVVHRVACPPDDARHPEPQSPGVRTAQAKVLYAAGMLADDQGDYEAARALFQESLALARALGDRPGTATALNLLGGQALQARDYLAAQALYEESLAIWRAVGDRWWAAATLAGLGRVALRAGKHATARAYVESGLEIQRQLQDRRAIARSLNILGSIDGQLGDYEAARACYEESLAISRELGAKGVIEEALSVLGNMGRDRGDHDAMLTFHGERLTIAREVGSASGIAESLYYLGLVAHARGDGSRAATLWSESLETSHRLGEERRIAECLEGFASLAARACPEEPRPEAGGSGGAREAGDRAERAARAARLFGAASILRERARIPIEARNQAEAARQVTAVRGMLDAATFAAAWEAGRAMPLDQVVAFALSGS